MSDEGELKNKLQILWDEGQKIDRFYADEFQFAIGIDDVLITCFSSAKYSSSLSDGFEFFADYNDRTIESAGLCLLVGQQVLKIELLDSSLVMTLENDACLTFTKSYEFENFQISCESLGVFIY